VLSHLTLRVAHQDTGDAAAPTLTISVPGADPSTPRCTGTARLHTSAALTTETVVLPAACPVTDASQVAGLQITYAAHLAGGATAGTDRLDGAALDMIVDAPRLEAESGCTLTTGYPSADACAAVRTTDDAAGDSRMVVNGSIYTPAAPVDLAMNRLASPAVTGAVIARTIQLALTPAARYPGPLLGPAPHTASLTFTTYPDATGAPGTATSAGTGTTFTVPGNARTIDGSAATATFAGGKGTASIDLGGWSGTSPVAGGHAVLRIAHQDDGPITSLTAVVSLPGAGVAMDRHGESARDRRPTAGAPVVDQFDLSTGAGLLPPGRDLSPLRVGLTATGTAGSVERLDGMQLDLLGDAQVTATVTYTGGTARITSWKTP
jgi:hypothetical protein